MEASWSVFLPAECCGPLFHSEGLEGALNLHVLKTVTHTESSVWSSN